MLALREKQLILSPAEELNWSGRGQHVEFEESEKLPLEVKSIIDHGATAVVDVVLCRRIKLARKSVRCNRRMTPEMVLQEVEHLQRLRHCHIIQLVGSYLQGGRLAILLYPVADFNLEDFLEYVIEKDTNGDIRRSLRQHCGCLVHALDYIHNSAIKHMDIKPRNVLVKQLPSNPNKYRFYISDFGVSRTFEDHSQTDGPAGKSFRYCSPEVYNEDLRGRSADVFSMGCVLLEIWTVWAGESLEDFAESRSNDKHRSYQANLPAVMQWIGRLANLVRILNLDSKTLLTSLEILQKMLEVNPQRRPLMKEVRETFPSNTCCNKGPEPYESEIQKLVKAASEGNETMVRILLNEEVNVDAMDEDGTSALHNAARNGHKAVVLLLLEHKADANARDYCRETAMHWGVKNGHKAVVQVLLEHKADVNVRNNYGETALHWGVKNGHEAVVQLLLEHKADINMNDAHGSTALHKAVVNLKDNDGRAVLYWAIRNGHKKMVKLLLEHQADVNMKDAHGWTALHTAACYGHEAVMQQLLGHKTDINVRDNYGETALHSGVKNGHEAVVQMLLEHQADVNMKGAYEWTALHTAAFFGREMVMQLLLEHKADANVRDNYGETALHWGVKKGHEAVVQLLLEHKADVNVRDNYGQTALHWGVRNGHEAVVLLLLEHKADVNIKDTDGQTAMFWAVRQGQKEMQQLLEHKVDVNSKDNDGRAVLY
jgi:ankyrin repeat protein